MRGALAAIAVVALIVLAANAMAEPAVQQAAGDRQRATKRLKDKRFTRYTESGQSSFDQRLHLCANKRFIYDTVSSAGITTRTTGRWRVTRARIDGDVWRARVRGNPDGRGRRVTVRIRTNGRHTTIDGNLVIADRSDLC
jgi:hypothetical protein